LAVAAAPVVAAAWMMAGPPGGAHADSIFSAHGLGEVVTAADVRGRGMGGVSVAVPDSWNLSRINPALLAATPGFVLHGEVIRESRRIEDQNGEVRKPRSANFPLFRLAVPVPRIGAFGLGFAQYTDVSYELRQDDGGKGEPVTQILRGRNGLHLLDIAWARAVHPKLDVGLALGVVLGSYIDVWENRFDDPDLSDSIDSLIVNHSRGPLLTLGATGTPAPRWRVGGAFTLGRDIDLRPEIRTTGQPSRRLPESELHLPASLAVGASHELDDHWRLAGDLVHTRWAATDLSLGSDPTLNRSEVPTENVTRVAVGVEYQGDRSGESSRLRDRIPLRAGYAWEPWHFRDPFGERIVDHFVTGGLGIPLPEGAGVVQLALELGFRGDLDRNRARERVVRLGLGLAAREQVVVGRVPER
jgi:hypothetical protein